MAKTDIKDAEGTTRIFVKRALFGLFVYGFFKHVVLCFSPGLFRIYLRNYHSFEPLMPADAPKDITPVLEVFGVHDYAGVRPYMNAEVVIFRNYTDCQHTFDNIVLPRRNDQVDTYTKIKYIEESSGNAYRHSVERGEYVDRKLSEVLSRKDPNEFASFLKIFSEIDFKDLLNAQPEDKFLFDSSFISFFKKPVVSTSIHAAPAAQTMSLQCYGTKSWLFWKSSDLEKYGARPITSPQGNIMAGDPESLVKIPTKVATVYPGDMMYFPPLYYHAVATNPGKNVMFAIRKLDRESLWQSFSVSPSLTMNFFFRTLHTMLYNSSGKIGFFHNKEVHPFKNAHLEEVRNKQFEKFGGYDGLADFHLP